MLNNHSKEFSKVLSLTEVVPELLSANPVAPTTNGLKAQMNNFKADDTAEKLVPPGGVPESEPKSIISKAPGNLGKPPKKSRRKKNGQVEADYDKVTVDAKFHRLIQQLDIKPSLDRPIIIGVTSTLRGEGRTTVAMGLASALSQMVALPIALLETDLENPALAQDFDLPAYGVSEYLRGELELDDLTQSTNLPDLAIVVAGQCDVPALDLLRSQRLPKLLKILNQHFAAVVVDLPPMCRTGEATRVMAQVDKVVMVVEAGSTPGKLVKSAMELIPEEKLLGVVLNRTRPAFGLARLFERLFGG